MAEPILATSPLPVAVIITAAGVATVVGTTMADTTVAADIMEEGSIRG